MSRGSVAFVLTGGANLGSVQVGMLQALAGAGVVPHMVVGASVGALNAAWVATRPWPEGLGGLEQLWRSLRRQDVFPLRPLGLLAGALGGADHLVDPSGLARLIEAQLPGSAFGGCRLPLRVVATEVTSGLEVIFSDGPLAGPLLASTALPGIFPPVTVGGHDLMDGGVADNAPISVAADMGATEVWVLPTGYSCALERPPRHPVAQILHAFSLLVQQRLIHEVALYQDRVALRVLPPLCPLAVAPMDFSQSGRLIDRSRSAAARALASARWDQDQTSFLGLHRH